MATMQCAVCGEWDCTEIGMVRIRYGALGAADGHEERHQMCDSCLADLVLETGEPLDCGFRNGYTYAGNIAAEKSFRAREARETEAE